jgi:hypothetical protein
VEPRRFFQEGQPPAIKEGLHRPRGGELPLIQLRPEGQREVAQKKKGKKEQHGDIITTDYVDNYQQKGSERAGGGGDLGCGGTGATRSASRGTDWNRTLHPHS